MIMKCQVFLCSCSHCCFHLNRHCLPHFGYLRYLLYGDLCQNPLLVLPNKSSNSFGQCSSGDEVNKDVYEHEEFLGVVVLDLHLTLGRGIINRRN